MQHIGLGTAAIGRPQYINIKSEGAQPFSLDSFKQQGFDVLEAAYNEGIRYFDTAPGYGIAEDLLMEWLKQKNDPTIEIATKWGYVYLANLDPNATVHELKDHSVQQLKKQWEVSKQLLPNLKILQIHSATFDTGVLENSDVLNRLYSIKSEHNIKIGMTSTGDNQVDVLIKAKDIKMNGSWLFDVFQVTYNILDQSVLSVCSSIISSGRTIVVKEALANGRVFRNSRYSHYNKLYAALEKLSAQYNVGVDAIALRFCIQTLTPQIVLSGASSTIQIGENLKANTFQLKKEDIIELQALNIKPTTYWSERKKLGWN